MRNEETDESTRQLAYDKNNPSLFGKEKFPQRRKELEDKHVVFTNKFEKSALTRASYSA
jgi:hypothetical protein